MKRIHITILEEEEDYVRQLAFAIEKREKENLQVSWYTDLQRCLEENKGGELLLIGEEFQEESVVRRIRENCPGVILLLLSSDGVTEEWSSYPVIEKYSPVGNIIRRLYRYAAEGLGEDTYLPDRKKHVIGVYAPWNLELSMLFCEVLLQMVSEPTPALYVSLQECLGRVADSAESEEENLSDVICFLRRRPDGASVRIKSVSRKLGKGWYLPPADNPEHLTEMTRTDYEQLWKAVMTQQEYQTIIMEFGSAYPKMYEDMRQCTVVYCPYQDEVLQEARRQQLERRLELCGEKELQLHFVKMPRLLQGGGGKEELFCSSFGDTVRGLVGSYGS